MEKKRFDLNEGNFFSTRLTFVAPSGIFGLLVSRTNSSCYYLLPNGSVVVVAVVVAVVIAVVVVAASVVVVAAAVVVVKTFVDITNHINA